MISPKFDLYKSEWLELVFDDRNKAYGAYDLRKNYASTLVKTLGITALAFIGLFEGYNLILQHHEFVRIVEVHTDPRIIQVVNPVKPITPPKPIVTPQVKNVATIKYSKMVVTPDKQAENPPDLKDLKGAAISDVTKKGTDIIENLDVPVTNSGTGVTEDKSVHEINTIEVMPTFAGGEAAWAKFLQKNLRYPQQAIEAGISGKVYISFVVEKDGHLSNITVERTPGYGLDAEAVRVLKLVPPWKPGIQNGQAVRVRYNMPFNFQIPPSD